MKHKLVIVCAAASLLTACYSHHNHGTEVSEPAGAATTNRVDLPDTPARDINNRPYSGVDPNYDEQRELNPRAPSGMPPQRDKLESEDELENE